MKYKYRYDNQTKKYQVEREGLATPYFTNLRNCKLSWKFLNTATWTVDGKTIHTFKETINDKEERRIEDSTTKEKSTDDKDNNN